MLFSIDVNIFAYVSQNDFPAYKLLCASVLVIALPQLYGKAEPSWNSAEPFCDSAEPFHDTRWPPATFLEPSYGSTYLNILWNYILEW